MNIGITTFTYPPNKDGVAEASRVMAEGLAAYGWSVTVFTSGDPSVEPEMLNGVRVQRYRLSGAWTGRGTGGDEARRYVEDVLQGTHKILVIQCWDAWNGLFLLPHLGELTCPLVVVSHGYGRHIPVWAKSPSLGLWNWGKGLWWTATKLPRMMKAARKVVFLSERKDNGRFFDHRLASIFGHPGIEVIPNSFDEDDFRTERGRFRARQGITWNAKVFLCVANYSDRKNQILALKSFHDAALPDAVLIFIGSELNSYSEKLQEAERLLATDERIGKVIFLHGLTREETLQAYMDADCFVLSAKAETQPIVLLEAIGAGIPWISTDTGCVSEMPGGLVVQSRAEMTAAMRRLARNPEFASATARTAHGQRAEAFSRQTVVRRFHKMATECLAASHASSRE